MRELIKAMFRFSWANSLFGIRQMTAGDMGGADSAKAFDQVAETAVAGLEGSFQGMYGSGVRMLDEAIDAAMPSSGCSGSSAAPPGPAPPAPGPAPAPPVVKPLLPADSGRLNTTRFIVLGEGLAAGMGEFTMYAAAQAASFPARMSRQMGRPFIQTLIQAPGIGNAFGFAELPVVVPAPLQSSVLDRIPPQPAANLSVPGLTVSDAVHLCPRQPLVDRENSKQTAVNLILGIRGIAYGGKDPLPTQLQNAISQKPTFAVVELGYSEAIEAAVTGNAAKLPSLASFQENISKILKELRAAGAEVLAMTIPDPTDTAHFSTVGQAEAVAKLDSGLLADVWRVNPEDLITANGLNEIGFQIFGASIGPLPAGSILPAAAAREIRKGIHELNQELTKIAKAAGCRVYDLHSLWKRWRKDGANCGRRTLTANYLGGIYSVNGYYPGATGQALIANEVLNQLNQEFGARFAPIDIAGVMATDPVAAYKPAPGPNWTKATLPAPAPPKRSPAAAGPAFLLPPQYGNKPLTLPPGLEQVLPLNPALSFFGDAISALNERSPQGIAFGSGGHQLFGGFAMVDSHLSGNVRIRFSPPVNGSSKFQMFLEGVTGDDEVLAAPRFFKMAFRKNSVSDVPGFVSSGTLNLNTGEVDVSTGALNIYALYSSTALNTLVSANPTFPLPPAAPLSFPGQYGTACLVFEQRPDGKLDFTFNGATFVPLGAGIVWPLNFSGPSGQHATIPAAGTTMHPHLALTTKQTAHAKDSWKCPEIPLNTLQEYTLFTPASSFGDAFTLNAPQFGGPAIGRSRLLGRLQIQFGPHCGNTVPVAIASTTAGGTLAPMDESPLAQLFPGRLNPGPLGFYENLRFPLRTYSLNDLAIIDDPFDIGVGLLDLSSGRLQHPLLHRGFINQDLIFALIRVEPGTPKNSFLFRGAAEFHRAPSGAPQFNYYGQVHIPYPAGFLFPDPNLTTGSVVGPNSSLDPYLWFWAFRDHDLPDVVKTGGGQLTSSRGEAFSYRYSIPGKPGRHAAEFEYENFAQQGKFRMHSLAWVGFGNSNTGSSAGEIDAISFTGFGVWSKNGVEIVELVSVQISTSPKAQYVGIQVGLADVSNVNTQMPADAFVLRKAEPGGYLCALGMPAATPPLAAAQGA